MDNADNRILVRKKKKKKISRFLGMVFLTIFIGIVTLAGFTVNRTLNILEIGSGADGNNTIEDLREIVTPLNKRTNILILGSDISYNSGVKSDDSPTRSDTIILAQIDPKNKEVRALSIPRDTRVRIPGYRGYNKINAAFALGGEQLAMDTVAKLTGVAVDHYVILKVGGLVNLIDILGGVDLYVDEDMKYRDNTAKLDIDLKKGWQHLNGEQAHGYVRYRYDANGDIGRVQRQQKFVRAVSEKLTNPVNLLKIPELAAEAKKNVISDLSSRRLLKIGYFVKGLEKNQIRMVMMPGDFRTIGGVSYWSVSDYLARNVITELFPDSEFAAGESSQEQDETAAARERRRFRITLRNASEDKTITRVIASRLKEEGWSVIGTSDTGEVQANSQLIVQTGIKKHVPALRESLGLQAEVINASTGDLYSDYTLVIGNDALQAYSQAARQ